MITETEARDLIDGVFEEEALAIGGLVAIHEVPDDLVWRLVKSLDTIRERVLRRIEAKPDFALAHFWLGMVSFNQNKKAAAKEHLEKYLELEPSGSEASTAKEILPLLK